MGVDKLVLAALEGARAFVNGVEVVRLTARALEHARVGDGAARCRD